MPNRFLLLLFAGAIQAMPSNALGAATANNTGASCKREISTFCKGISDRQKLAECLIKNENQASVSCQQYLDRLKQKLKKVSPAAPADDAGIGEMDSGRGGAMMMGAASPSIGYNGWYTPYATPAGIQFHQGRASYPLFKGDADTISVSLLANTLRFDNVVTLASGVHLPTQFYKVELGGQYAHKLEGGHMFGGGAQIGGASDQPFSDTPTYGVNAFFSLNDPEHSRWIFSLQYSNNSTFLNGKPIPGIVYVYRTENFMGMFGFPFASIRWKPASPWVISASVFGTSLSGEVAYGERNSFQGFVGYHAQRFSYLRYGRTNPDDRVKFDEKRAVTGLRFPLFSGLQTELSAGYAFGRALVESSKSGLSLDGTTTPTSFDNTWFAGWSFRVAL